MAKHQHEPESGFLLMTCPKCGMHPTLYCEACDCKEDWDNIYDSLAKAAQ